MIRVTVWNENIHDREVQEVKELYPLGIHGTLAAYLNTLEGVEARTATLEQPECGLPDEVLNNTDVMIWWGHCGHHLVPDELARKVADRVLGGMGLIVLHSGHYSKPFRLLMGTTCSLRWRDGDFERMWCMNPGHRTDHRGAVRRRPRRRGRPVLISHHTLTRSEDHLQTAYFLRKRLG